MKEAIKEVVDAVKAVTKDVNSHADGHAHALDSKLDSVQETASQTLAVATSTLAVATSTAAALNVHRRVTRAQHQAMLQGEIAKSKAEEEEEPLIAEAEAAKLDMLGQMMRSAVDEGFAKARSSAPQMRPVAEDAPGDTEEEAPMHATSGQSATRKPPIPGVPGHLDRMAAGRNTNKAARGAKDTGGAKAAGGDTKKRGASGLPLTPSKSAKGNA